jgi:hypothetical protein
VKINVYVIDFEIPARVKRWGLRIGIPAIVLGAAAVALAGTPLHVWSNGDVLDAGDLNGNFANLQGQINAGRFVRALPDSGASVSTGATLYCGTGPTNTTGVISYNGTGYPAARAMCQQSSGCGSSPTAHMCSAEEMLLSAQLGISMPGGWFSSFTAAAYTYEVADCVGWTNNASNYLGLSWNGTQPYVVACSTSIPVLCCD